MEELFVKFGTTIPTLAREKGFDQPCIKYMYHGDTHINTDYECRVPLEKSENFNLDYLSTSIPMYQQLTDWFRVKHNIFIMIYPREDWCYMVQDMDELSKIGNVSSFHGIKYKTFYDALDKALLEAFKLI